MVMYCDIMISAQQLNQYGEFSIPTYISGDTEKIYGLIDELGLQDMLNNYQTDVYLHRRMDIGSVPVPKYIWELSDIEIDGLSLSIDIPLTSSDELKVFITFIRNHQIESLFFG
tara:strand:- start:789 stop:1130 length:342 start_codon:yes stop_codon:yes gene_type:complete